MQDAFTDAVTELRAGVDALLAAAVLQGPDQRAGTVAQSAALRAVTERVVVAAVDQARARGISWQEIGDALGVTRQAAFQKYGKPIDPRTGDLMNTTPLPAAPALAAETITALAAGRWDAVRARFDPTMTDGLPAEALAAAWTQIIGLVGGYVGHDEPSAVRAADVTITNTLLRFEAGEYTARITFRDDASIAGLYILDPAQA